MRLGPRAAPVVVIAALVVAEAAVLLLRPRGGVIEAAPVDAQGYFTPAELDRATDFRGPQLALYGAGMAIQAGVLVLLVARPPRALRGVWCRPLLASGAAGAGISLAVAAATLPVGAIMRQRSIDVGLTTRSWPGWAWDVGRSVGIGALFAGIATAGGIGLMRRFARRWWLPASGLVVVVGAAFTFAGPLVLDPIFNRFDRLPAGATRDEVLSLARRAGVDVGEVYVVDASKRTTAANAYVNGIGSSKRVVLYDNLLEDFSPSETRLVVAHELAHVRHRDVPRALLFLAIVSPLALLAAAGLTRRWRPDRGEPAGPRTVPALTLAFSLMALLVGTVSNQLSRAVERRADTYALELTGEAQPFIAMQHRLAVKNVSDPDPPALVRALLGSHPTTVERIGVGEAYEREHPPAGRTVR